MTRRRFAILFISALVLAYGAAACGTEEGPADGQERLPVQEPEPPEPTEAAPTDRTVGENIQG